MDKTATLRVARGAVWYDGPRYSRLVEWWSSDCSKYSVGSVGFRLVEEIVAPEPVPFAPLSLHVDRGGSWSNYPRYARFANRNIPTPGNRYNDLGFRLVEVFDE